MAGEADIITNDDAVYAAVCYADIFDMPVEIQMLRRQLVVRSLTLLETSMTADNLVASGRMERRGDVVHLTGREQVIELAAEAATRAAEQWPAAEEWAQRLARIPLVRMVSVTGGLARNQLRHGEPVEFFIVTRPRRLWLTRAMIRTVERAAKRKDFDFVVSHVVTTRSVEFETPTLHLAHELTTMAVIVGDAVADNVRRSNAWIFDMLPNASRSGDITRLAETPRAGTRKWGEWLLLTPPFKLLETFLRQRAEIKPGNTTEVCTGLLTARCESIEHDWQQRFGRGQVTDS